MKKAKIIPNLKFIWKITVVALINILVVIIALNISREHADALSKYGSKGNEVTQIQTKLRQWGYYNGNVDGIYGLKTENAVIYFQKKNKLKIDGIAGPETLAAIGISSSGNSNSLGLSTADINLLARVISAESRGEPYLGQVAVGAVVLNRINHPSFPNTLSGVIYQPGAFTCVTDGQINQPVSDSAKKAAQDAINGSDPSSGAIYYYNPAKTTNKWILSRPVITTIGKHKFCK